MARELIEVNPSDESSLPSRERTDRGRETYSRTSAGYRETDSARTPEFSDSLSPSYSPRRSPERSRRRAQVSDDVDAELAIDLEQDDEERFLRTSRRVPVRRSALPKKLAQRLKLGVTIAAVLLVAGGAGATAYGYGMHSWRFRIASSDNVEISGVHNASRAHVMEVAGADIGRNVFFVPLEERKRQLEQIPWVESATVMRLWPNRIAVDIEERTPVAFAQVGPRISLIDANGVIMGMPANRQTKYSFPVIRGISDTEPLSSRAAAMKIYNQMAQDLDSGGEGARYTRQLSEVDLSDPEDVKVIANDAGGTLLIHLGSSNFLERYKLYLGHIAEWRQQFPSLQSVDLRYDGQIIVNPDVPPAPKVEKPAVPAAPAKQIHRSSAETRKKHWKKKK